MTEPNTKLYDYRATVLTVVDGDTVNLSVDLGFGISITIKTRLLGIDAPEMNTEAGRLAKAHLSDLLPVGRHLWAVTTKDRQEKYGRYLVTLWPWDGDEQSINQRMIDDGHATIYGGGAR